MTCIKISQSAILPSKIIVQSASFKNVGVKNVVGGGNATALLKNTVPTLLSTTVIALGDSADIIAPDASSIVKDSDGNILDTVLVASGASEDINLIIEII